MQILSNISKKVNTASNVTQSLVTKLSDNIIKADRYREDKIGRSYHNSNDGMGNAFHGIASGVSKIMFGATEAAVSPFMVAGTATSEGIKLVSGGSRSEPVYGTKAFDVSSAGGVLSVSPPQHRRYGSSTVPPAGGGASGISGASGAVGGGMDTASDILHYAQGMKNAFGGVRTLFKGAGNAYTQLHDVVVPSGNTQAGGGRGGVIGTLREGAADLFGESTVREAVGELSTGLRRNAPEPVLRPNSGTVKYGEQSSTNAYMSVAHAVSGVTKIAKGAMDVVHGTADIAGGALGKISQQLGKYSEMGVRKLQDYEIGNATNQNRTFSENFKNMGLGMGEIVGGAAGMAGGIASVSVGVPSTMVKKIFGQEHDLNRGMTDFGIESGGGATAGAAKIMFKGLQNVVRGTGGLVVNTGRAIGTGAVMAGRAIGAGTVMAGRAIGAGGATAGRAISSLFTNTVRPAVAAGLSKAKSVFGNFAEGVGASFTKTEQGKVLDRMSSIPFNVNIDENTMGQLGASTKAEAYASILNMRKAWASMGESRGSSNGGYIADVAGFRR